MLGEQRMPRASGRPWLVVCLLVGLLGTLGWMAAFLITWGDLILPAIAGSLIYIGGLTWATVRLRPSFRDGLVGYAVSVAVFPVGIVVAIWFMFAVAGPMSQN